ncbi:MAG: aminotransferase family protein [Promethearchaeota archaeon]
MNNKEPIKESNKESIRKSIKEFTSNSFGTWRKQSKWQNPKVITDAEGVFFTDLEGRNYLDFSSQLMCSNLGHKNQKVADAISNQAQKLTYMAPGFATEAGIEAVKALRSIVPDYLSKFFFSTSGTEANEAAIKMIRMMQSPKYKIISRYKSYHGATASSLSITGDPRRWWAERARLKIEGIVFAPDPYCYRCPFGLKYGECNIQCARYVEYMIKEEGNVAAIFVEPVVGTNGRFVPPPEYYPLLRQICDDHEVLLVADEVMSGWFRTGKLFAIEHWKVKPDIITTAKGLTGANTPVGLTMTQKSVSDFFQNHVLFHGHTYSYHSLSLSAIPPAISEYQKLKKSGLMAKTSEYLEQKLYELGEKHNSVGDVRGIGHFWALELVQNRETKKPFNVKADKYIVSDLMTGRVAQAAMEKGLYVFNWYDTLAVAPPLIITAEEIDKGIKILDEVLEISDKYAKKTNVPVSKSSQNFNFPA